MQLIPPTEFSKEEILKVVRAECPDFELIPKNEQWLMAMYASGSDTKTIAEAVQRPESLVIQTIEKYKNLISIITDEGRALLAIRAAWTGIPVALQIATDKTKVEKLSALQGVRLARDLMGVINNIGPVLDYMREQNERLKSEDFSNLGKLLDKAKGENGAEEV